MQIGPFTIARTKALGQLAGVDNRGGWWPLIREPFIGAWQRNEEITVDNVTTHATVFACATLTASDIAKMRLRLVQEDVNHIWDELESPSFSPVLRRPNHYQNRIQFITSWVISKQLHGNTYVLLRRDNRRVVTAMYVLDPTRVVPLVAPNGDVYYGLKRDDLSHVAADLPAAPASEIIHDRQNTIFHPLVGLSPIYASGLAAVQGLNIQNNSTRLFQNASNPGGVLTAPGAIKQETAERLKAYWDANYTGDNVGKVAVLGDGLKFERMTFTAVDSQLIEQLQWTSENVCSAFHVPPYMVGVGPPPNYNNIEALNQQYYSQCLQILIESIELCLDEGLGLTEGETATKRYGVEFDIDDLLRMDSATKMSTLETGKNYYTPNEGRRRLNLKPVTGGDTVYRQQQDFSLEALNKRDEQADPFATGTPAPKSPAPVSEDETVRHLSAADMKMRVQAHLREKLWAA